ncbi:class I SAM-dependent methyltransferase [Streptomyces sp. NPDC097619]|uniref:class I SAM-dependent methyltransferase n=1 Tax=Streptomyces sp. NPDC097619 TaxID=3157228 RepID=UPI00331FDAB5
MTNPFRARSFDSAAARYATHRPSYPDALFSTLESLTGHPLRDADVADVGAGTGIATALLHARGARVLGVEPGPGMGAEFRRRLPGVPLVRGDGNRLPLASGSLDLITYAQSFHWTDPARSVPEALRVLRPGGALALFWNEPDVSVPWTAAQDARLRARFGDGWYASDHTLPDTGTAFTDRWIRWSRRISVADHLAKLSTHSLFLVPDQEGTADFLESERSVLEREFPDGFLEERYVVTLRLAVR